MVRRLAVITLLLLPTLGAAQIPVGWRGDGTGRFANAQPLLTWSKQHVKWKTELPGGSPASPILIGDRLFVMSDPAVLICVRATDGAVLWKRGHSPAEFGDRFAEARDASSHNPDGDAGSAASTPVSDGQTVYAVFANGIVSAHDLSGKPRWVRFLERPKTAYGHAASPILAGGRFVVHFIDLFALDPATGKEAWRVKLPATHASPVVTRLGDVDLLVHPAGAILRDGNLLAKDLFRLDQASPVVQDGVIYANENGKLRAFALPASPAEPFVVKPLWETPTTRGQYQIASPVVHEGRVYTVSLGGIFQATDAVTGRQLYRERLPFSSRVYVSLHFAGGRLLAADQTGKTVVLEPGPTYRELAVNELDYHPTGFAFGDRRTYVRTHRHVMCVGP